MDATNMRGWLLALALPGSALSGDAAPPAFLPPSTFSARLAARPLTPVAADPRIAADHDATAVPPQRTLRPMTEIARPAAAPPSFSLQPDYERAMRTDCDQGLELAAMPIDPAAFEKLHLSAVPRLALDAADATELGLTPIKLSAGELAGEYSPCRIGLSSLRDGAAVVRLVGDE